MTEKDWWTAIKASPEDPLVVLAFADWLEEQGDLRTEGLRCICSLGKRPYDCKYSIYWTDPPGAPRRAACWGRAGFYQPDIRVEGHEYDDNLIPDELWDHIQKETVRPPPSREYPWKHFFVEGEGQGPLIEKGLRVLLTAWVAMKDSQQEEVL